MKNLYKKATIHLKLPPPYFLKTKAGPPLLFLMPKTKQGCPCFVSPKVRATLRAIRAKFSEQ